jgi:enolase-phosphatase E1
LFFGHTLTGDLLRSFQGHYDTAMGSKREVDSYRRILDDAGVAPQAMLFLSDVVDELDAARQAGVATGLCLRPGNAPVDDYRGHPILHRFVEIVITSEKEPQARYRATSPEP